MRIREARTDDFDRVRALCRTIWPDRDAEYIDRIFPDWIAGDDRCTLVGIDDGTVCGIGQCVDLGAGEGWYQGLRVHPDARGDGVASELLASLGSWARDRGISVVRAWVYSWNGPGMGVLRSNGFEAVTSFRWARPEPAIDATPGAGDSEQAWQRWRESDARVQFDGLSLDRRERWAFSTCTPEDVRAGDGIVVSTETGGAMTYLADVRRDHETVGIYATSAWGTSDAAERLFEVIARDAAERGCDRVRVPIPERPLEIADVAAARIPFDPEPQFVFGAKIS